MAWQVGHWQHERTGTVRVGEWAYDGYRNRDRFYVRIGNGQPFAVYGDSPEWGRWRLMRAERGKP